MGKAKPSVEVLDDQYDVTIGEITVAVHKDDAKDKSEAIEIATKQVEAMNVATNPDEEGK